ncbi:MAG: efflux RND transporter periplasmic adaptor subunit [Flavobacteriaceae bacterium]
MKKFVKLAIRHIERAMLSVTEILRMTLVTLKIDPMKKIKYTLLLIVSLFMSFNCGDAKKGSAETLVEENNASSDQIQLTQDQFNSAKMALGTLEEKPFPIRVKTNGMIDVPPENRAVVNATMGGYIKRTPLLIGDVVKQGQLLVTIENPEFITLQQEYMELSQQLGYLKSEFERQQTLMEENITSEKSFLKAESEYKSANARSNGLKKQLQMLNISISEVEKGNLSSIATIYAPISGSITKVNVNKGTYVSPATPILEIIDNDHIHLELSVFEKDILKLKKGQPIHFKIPEASEEYFEAEVHLIGTSIEENRTIKVHGHLHDESKHHFLTGMFVDAEIITASDMALALPTTAIVTLDDKSYVLMLNQEANGSLYFDQVEVKVGTVFDGYTPIEPSERFDKNSRFLVSGAFDLLGE